MPHARRTRERANERARAAFADVRRHHAACADFNHPHLGLADLHDAAAHAYRAAIRADPSFAAAHWDLGAALVEQGSPERAAEGHAALGEALRLEPTFLTAAARPLFAEISQSLATLSES